MMGSGRRSAERESFWRLALEEYRVSGLSVRAFCSREGLSEPSFYSWRRKFQHRDAAASGSRQNLVEVRVVERSTQNADAGHQGESAAYNRQSMQQIEPAAPSNSTSQNLQPRHSPSQQFLEIVTPGKFTLRFPAQIEPRQLGAVLNVIAQCKEAQCKEAQCGEVYAC